MKILHVNHFGTNVGGVESYIADVVAALAKRGHTSHLIHFEADQGDLIAATTHVPLVDRTHLTGFNGKPLADLEKISLADQVIPKIERVISEFRPDIAYVHVVHHSELVEWLAQRLPILAYVHSPFIVCPGYAQFLKKTLRVCPHKVGLSCMLYAQIENCCFGNSPLTHAYRLKQVRSLLKVYRNIPVLVGSRYMQQLLHRNGIPVQHINILPPVLLEETSPESLPAPKFQKILFAGRVVPEKGLRHLIEALGPIQTDWELLVAGDGAERYACQALASQLGVSGKIKFLGWVHQTELRQIYQECAFVVVPSLWPEPFGRTGPEAFWHGRPVIAYNVGGVPDWLQDGISGYLVPPGDIIQLRRRIQSLFESPTQQIAMGRNAHAYAFTTWQADSHVKSLVNYFERTREETGMFK